MAANVFGNPVTNATLEAMSKYIGKTIYPVDRAIEAINMKNDENKAVNAETYVQNLKKQWGDGVSALCLVYNGTGNSLSLHSTRDWYGHIGQAPYPQLIQNGQWGAFLHVKSSGALSGSEGGVVYRGKNGNEGKTVDYMMAWSIPWLTTQYDNSVWAETREEDHYTDDRWEYIYNKLDDKRFNYTDEWDACYSTIATGDTTSPLVQATLTLKGAIDSRRLVVD